MVRRAIGISACIGGMVTLLGGEIHAQEAQDPTGGAGLSSEDVRQIAPPSPVAGGNDPNASDDVLYVLESNDEDAARTQKLGRKAHFLVNPVGRGAASVALSPALKVETFVTSGLAAFNKPDQDFGVRTSSGSGGLNAIGNLQLFNYVLAYEHREAHKSWFGPWSATGDKVGVTLNKTYPLFVQNLSITPQVQTSRDMVDPYKSSMGAVETTIGLTYDASPRLSLAGSAGYEGTFLYGVSGSRTNQGLKLNVGTTVRVTKTLTLIVGASTSRTFLYGLPTYRSDGSISPQATARYQVSRFLTLNLVANYQRFLSTATGQGTYKYNVNPSIALTVPL